MNSRRNRLGKQEVLGTTEGVGERVIFTSHTAQTIENDLWLLKCLNWTATQYVKQTKIVCSPVDNGQLIWLKNLYSIRALLCMHVHTCARAHTHTHTQFFPPNFYCNEGEGKALDIEVWDMVLDFSEIQNLKLTKKHKRDTFCRGASKQILQHKKKKPTIWNVKSGNLEMGGKNCQFGGENIL